MIFGSFVVILHLHCFLSLDPCTTSDLHHFLILPFFLFIFLFYFFLSLLDNLEPCECHRSNQCCSTDNSSRNSSCIDWLTASLVYLIKLKPLDTGAVVIDWVPFGIVCTSALVDRWVVRTIRKGIVLAYWQTFQVVRGPYCVYFASALILKLGRHDIIKDIAASQGAFS